MENIRLSNVLFAIFQAPQALIFIDCNYKSTTAVQSTVVKLIILHSQKGLFLVFH
jgi:hypothetical protein